jgi:hypothetical protein
MKWRYSINNEGRALPTNDGRRAWPLLRDVSMLVLALSAAGASIWAIIVATQLDSDDRNFVEQSTCASQLLSARTALFELTQGYTISPYEKSDRLNDWFEASSSLDNVEVSCIRLLPPGSKRQSEFTALRGDFAEEMATASNGSWAPATVDKLTNWIAKAIPSVVG